MLCLSRTALGLPDYDQHLTIFDESVWSSLNRLIYKYVLFRIAVVPNSSLVCSEPIIDCNPEKNSESSDVCRKNTECAAELLGQAIKIYLFYVTIELTKFGLYYTCALRAWQNSILLLNKKLALVKK